MPNSAFPRARKNLPMQWNQLQQRIDSIAHDFSDQRAQRQRRRSLDAADFKRIADSGYVLVGVPAADGGLWSGIAESVRPVCTALRTLARADSSVALVAAMHPAVLSYWLTAPAAANDAPGFREQCRRVYDSAKSGCWWGTITSEPGSGGDVARTRTTAEPTGEPNRYLITGPKHFGSGSGVMDYMVTSALPSDDGVPDWFFVETRGVPQDGSSGMRLIAEWDGHGMTATQSHAIAFERFPAERIAYQGDLPAVSTRTGGFIGCLFTSVIVGIIDAAMEAARDRLAAGELRAYEQVEWARTRIDAWLLNQAYEGMLRAVEQKADSRYDVLLGKTAVAEIAESVTTRLCRIIGGGTFSRYSPFGFWAQDVKALGFLRPPWGLAMETMIQGEPAPGA